MPVAIDRKLDVCCPQTGQTALRAGRVTATRDGLDRFRQELAHNDDGAVRRPQLLSRSIDDRPHKLLERAVLGVDAEDA